MIDPLDQYHAWFRQALEAGEPDPKAACLSTTGADGRPSGRMVLVQYADARGLVFFTNLGSRKAHDLTAHAWAALTFHWPRIERQVRAEGRVTPVTDAEADQYFSGRPRESQIGAWASRQSEALGSRSDLEARVAAATERFLGQPVPRPPFWSGYRVVPDRIEFWTGGVGRLHHREQFDRHDPSAPWRSGLVFP